MSKFNKMDYVNEITRESSIYKYFTAVRAGESWFDEEEQRWHRQHIGTEPDGGEISFTLFPDDYDKSGLEEVINYLHRDNRLIFLNYLGCKCDRIEYPIRNKWWDIEMKIIALRKKLSATS